MVLTTPSALVTLPIDFFATKDGCGVAGEVLVVFSFGDSDIEVGVLYGDEALLLCVLCDEVGVEPIFDGERGDLYGDKVLCALVVDV